jgi:hypothetical protein
MVVGKGVKKALQRSLYSFFTNKWAIVLLVVFAFITLNSLLHVLESVFRVGNARNYYF